MGIPTAIATDHPGGTFIAGLLDDGQSQAEATGIWHSWEAKLSPD